MTIGNASRTPGDRLREAAEVQAFATVAWVSDVALARLWGATLQTPHPLLPSLGVLLAGGWVAFLLTTLLPARRFAAAFALLVAVAAVGTWGARFGPPSLLQLLLGGPLVALAAFALGASTGSRALVVAAPLLVFGSQLLKVIDPRVPWAGLTPRGLLVFAVAVTLTLAVRLVSRRLASPADLARLTRPFLAASLLGTAAGLSALVAWSGRAFSVTSRDGAAARGGAPPSGLPNVVLVVVDTLRADRLGVYGHGTRPTSPLLDRFARDADVYRNAYATSSWTSPSMASVFTGLAPEEHGLTVFGNSLPVGAPTLAESLRVRGYRTLGVCANPLLQASHGFGRGFDHYEVLTRLSIDLGAPSLIWISPFNLARAWKPHRFRWWSWKPRARSVTDASLAALATPGTPTTSGEPRRDRPAFLFVHYIDPHSPYDAPDSEATREWGAEREDARFDPWISWTYDRGIRSLDGELARLLENVDRQLGRDRTLVVVTSDHGEHLGEEGKYGHGTSLDEALVRVPLIVRRPGQTAGRNLEEAFSLVDLAALLLDGTAPPADAPIRAHLRSGPGFARRSRSVQRDGWKLVTRDEVEGRSAPVETLFRLPDERHDRRREFPGVASALRALRDVRPEVATPASLGEEERAKLRALGYLR